MFELGINEDNDGIMILSDNLSAGKNIIEVLGYSKNNYDIIVKKDTQGDPMYSIADISLAKKLINFKPKFSLKAGLIDTIKNRNI